MTNIAKVLEYLQTLGREVDFYTDHYNGESGHPCLVPDFRGNAFNFSPLRIMFA